MKNIKFILFGVFFLIACSEEGKGEVSGPISVQDKYDDSTFKYTIDSAHVRLEDSLLKGSVYRITNAESLDSVGVFNVGCDCCLSNIVFQEDGVFMVLDYCHLDVEVRHGKYQVDTNGLRLYYSGITANQVYNWEHESDSTEEMFLFSDTLVGPYESFYEPRWVKGSVLLFMRDSSNVIAISKDTLSIDQLYNRLNIELLMNYEYAIKAEMDAEEDVIL